MNSEYDQEKERERVYHRTRDSGERQQNRQNKKKKKHKDQRRSYSNDSRRERKHKKRHSRSRSQSHKKHKKQHKQHKSRKDRSKSKQKRQRSRSKQKRQKSRSKQRRQRQRSKSQNRQKRHKSEKIDRNQQKLRQKPREQKKQDQQKTFDRRRQPRQLDQKDPYFQQRRQIQRVRKYDPEKAQKMQQDLEKQIIFDAKTRQYEMMKEKFRQAQKQMQQAKREDHTILVYCLPLKAKEKDIWNFFSKAECGRIRDIRIIRDQRSGKSKGVAYVEFYTSQSVEKALTMKQRPIEVKGRQFTGLKIQHSQAQKNRAAAAAKQMKVTKQVDPYEQERQTLKRQTKVQIRGLYDKLADMQQKDLKQLFDPFGHIDYIDIHRDPETGKCKGFAFIQFSNIENARLAVKEMDNIQVIKGHRISVSTVSHIQKGDVSTGDDYLHSQGSKKALMNNLARDAPSYSNLQRPPMSTVPYTYIVMMNMFKMQGTSPAFFQNLKKDVTEKAGEFGIIEKIFIEKNNQGNIWIKYSDTVSAIKAHQKMNASYFDGKKVFCIFVTEQTWNKRVLV